MRIFRNLTLVLSVFLAGTTTLFASHGMGGEITWRCLGNGQFIFQMKFYRDCNGIPGPNSTSLTTNHPIGTINMPLVAQNDISPVGFESDGIVPCPTCSMGGVPNVPGLVEEFIYESAPVMLSGVPPTTGWTFSWGQCCRSSMLNNVLNSGGIGFSNRATMYPYNGTNTSPCFDSSPFFVEKPKLITCNGSPTIYYHLAGDMEMDSLSYSFDVPLDDFGTIVPFAPGYSVQQQLPGTSTLDQNTGELSFTPTSAGYFVVVIRVDAFKCGTLMASIWREINVVITNCPTLASGLMNTPPVVSAPFIDDNTGLQTSYQDTVIAGDAISFIITASDSELFGNFTMQSVLMNAFGLEYGFGFTDASSGCIIPPCATLTPPPPDTGIGSAYYEFNWTTTPAHLGYSFSCVQFTNTYHFLALVSDNFCPVNGSGSKVISITVMPSIPPPPLINNGGNLECNLGPNYIYQWFLNRFAIPGASASSYTPTQSGTYQVLAVAPSGQGNYSAGYLYNPLGLDDLVGSLHVSVRPNPASDGIFIVETGLKQDADLVFHVTDLSGREIMHFGLKQNSSTQQVTLDLSEQASGVYLLKVESGNYPASFLKLMKQ